MSGADGEPPERNELGALEAAIGFATIHQNPYWSPDGRHDAWRVATSDNADLWAQPINVTEGWIALGRGGRVETMSGGLNLNDDHFVISAPLELHRPFGVTLDPELVEAVYEVLAAGTRPTSDHAGQIQVAVRWLLRSWRNTPSITWEDRVVYVKVATEALSGTDSTETSAELLEAIFAGAASQPGEGLGTDRLLWDPSAASGSRNWTTMSGKAKTAVVSAFAHWYWALADARNALVYGEDGASLTYEVSGSPYYGPLIEVADRVVREAVCVLLGECGYPQVWRQGITRASFRAHKRLTAGTPDESDRGGGGAHTSA